MIDFVTHARTCSALALSASLLVPPVVQPQQATPRQRALQLGAAVLRAEGGPSSIGARWDGRLAHSGPLSGDVLPRTWHVEVESKGAAALDPEANLETMHAAVDLSIFAAFYKPSRDTGGGPNAPTVGGFDFGAVYVAARGAVEANQRFNEVAATLGGELRYTIERQDGVWPLVPSFHVSLLAVKPTSSVIRDSLNLPTESHRRGEINVVWHVPLFRSPFRAHADLRFWGTSGLPQELKNEDRDRGKRIALGLGWTRPWTVGRIRIDEIFGRWTGGTQPVIAGDEKAWMLGIVANLVSEPTKP